MTIRADILGVEAGPMLQEIDARWLMAYAAGIGDANPVYLDTSRKDGIVAHPVFAVCYEWPLALALRAKTIHPEAELMGVHATHDLLLHRLPVPGDRLTTTARIVGVEQRKPGAYVVTRYETRDASGAPVTTSDYGTLYRGVETAGPDRWLIERPTDPHPADGPGRWHAHLPISAGAAHVYTECARIWNPVHTDRAVAAAAGLPDTILHGTATLALAVSALLAREADDDPARVKRIRCRFAAMVLMPSTLTVQGLSRRRAPDGEAVGFHVLTEQGAPAIRDGLVILHG